MRLIDRHLVRGFVSALVYCIALITLLFVIIDSFNNLDEFIRYHVPFKIILSYYFYLFPTVIAQIIPASALVAILYVLGNLGRHNEIIALKASGISTLQILLPYIVLGGMISFSMLLLNETVIPKAAVTSTSIMDGLILKGKKNLEERAIKNVTLYGKGNRIIFAREYEILTQTLYDVNILEDNPNKILQGKITAKKAHYENGQWVLYDAMKYQLDRRGDIIGEPRFSRTLELNIFEKPEDFLKEESKIEFMNSRELKNYIENLKDTSRDLVRKLRVEFHYKIALAFASLIVMLTGAPLAMVTKRGSAMVGIGTSFLVVLLYYALNSVCLALGKGGYLSPVVAAWFSNIAFAGVGVYLIKSGS